MLKVEIPKKLSVPALEKLIDHVASGIGSIAGPMLTPLKAWGEAKALRIQAQAQKEALETLGYRDSDVNVELDIGNTVRQKIQFQETKRLLNTRAVVVEAASQLGDKEVPKNEPDHDWTARFFNCVQDVSTEDMQLLWAKVLAGEVERSGSTSLRTLDILRNLDQQTAINFRRFCSLSIYIRYDGYYEDGRVIPLGGHAGFNTLGEYGLYYRTLNILEEHGLIKSDYDTLMRYGRGLSDTEIANRTKIEFQGRNWKLASRTRLEHFELRGVEMTSSALELAEVIEPEADPAYADAFFALLKTMDVELIEDG